LKKARHWRKLKLRTLQASEGGDNPLKKSYRNNKSGIIGVCRSGNNWQAAWVEKGTPRNRKFSVEAHGEVESFQLACRARAEAEQRLYGEVMQSALQAYV
ncbi:MAG: AP2 domain-containing protein, partial [Acidobacteriota bacterium]|nr:AP2 domain-containing protein [Acidobacteriota bacterium]